MHPSKVDRARVDVLTDLPNVGKACVKDLQLLGIYEPHQLKDKCPFTMYEMLCQITASRHDPCVIDVFMSVTRFMAGEEARPWWTYTEERKQSLSGCCEIGVARRGDTDSTSSTTSSRNNATVISQPPLKQKAGNI